MMASTITAIPDFTAHRHPVLAVACPDCGVRVGAWCKRPSGHSAMDLHKARLVEADRVWELHKLPAITQVGPSTYVYDQELPMNKGDCEPIPEFLQAKLTRSPDQLAREAKACARRRKHLVDPPGRHIKMPSKRSIAAAKALSVPVGFLRSAGAESGLTTEATMAKKAKKTAGARRKGPTGKRVTAAPKSPRKATAKTRAATGTGNTKTADLEALLRNADGATLAAVCAAFGWQAHSARSAISTLPGKVKKARNETITIDKRKNAKDETVYFIPAAKKKAA